MKLQSEFLFSISSGNHKNILLLILISSGLASEDKHYHESQRSPAGRRSEDVNNGETRLTCTIPQGEGEVILTKEDKKLLTKESFKTFSECNSLSMKNLGISAMADGVFSDMEHLSHLFIEGDNIDIRPEIFEGLDLKGGTLSLINMSITSLPENIFAQFDGLLELTLEKNPLSELSSESIYGLTWVSWVNLAYTNIVIPPGLFQHVFRVHHLDVSGTPFTFTPGIWDGARLEVLMLENAGITNINGDSWTGLGRSLTRLSLNGNHFEILESQSFKGLRGVYDLGLENCGIKMIKAGSFEDLTSLAQLKLQGNPIVSMDETMFGSTPINSQLHIWFGCEFMPCFPGLCWIDEKMKLPDLTWCEPMCENYDKSVRQYIEHGC